jgi:DDE family transposase
MLPMPHARRPKVTEDQLSGFGYFKKLLPLLDRLHEDACERDQAHNRKLHFDQYVALLLLYFFNPIVTSLRGIVQASELKKVQRMLGCARASLGSLSEAAQVFDPELLLGVINGLAVQLRPLAHDARLDEVQGILTLVDGTLLRALPKVTQAMWQDEAHRAFKLHTHFELLKGVPVRMDATDANASERAQLAAKLEPDRVYVLDRGYAAFWLFEQILGAHSSFVCRIRDNSVFEVIEERPVTREAGETGVISDQIAWLGCESKRGELKQPLRIVTVQYQSKRGDKATIDTIRVATDLLDVPCDLISLIYRNRWGIEIFFRFFKHVLGCRHLLSHDLNGVTIQAYVAIIACMLIALWTGRKPTLRTFEMVCFYFTGLADLEELLAHIAKLKNQDA